MFQTQRECKEPDWSVNSAQYRMKSTQLSVCSNRASICKQHAYLGYRGSPGGETGESGCLQVSSNKKGSLSPKVKVPGQAFDKKDLRCTIP